MLWEFARSSCLAGSMVQEGMEHWAPTWGAPTGVWLVGAFEGDEGLGTHLGCLYGGLRLVGADVW